MKDQRGIFIVSARYLGVKEGLSLTGSDWPGQKVNQPAVCVCVCSSFSFSHARASCSVPYIVIVV